MNECDLSDAITETVAGALNKINAFVHGGSVVGASDL